MHHTSTITSIKNEAERIAARAQALAYQATLGKNGKPLKTKQAAA